MKLPSFEIPEEGYNLIVEFMRAQGVKSQSEAIRLLLEESPSLQSLAGSADLGGKFTLGGKWGGYRRDK